MNLTYNNGKPLIGRELELFLAYVKFRQLENQYVFLKEDEQGRYIEYVFKDGTPEHNRCLSWYDKPHPKYFERHPDMSQGRIHQVSDTEIYELSAFCCGAENDPDPNRRCNVGEPAPGCDYVNLSKNWSIDEPIKCACWKLNIIKSINFNLSLNELDQFNKLLKDSNKFIKLEWPDSQEYLGMEGCYTMNDDWYTTFIPETLVK